MIGILGGAFDPPHLGHLNLALEMLEKKQLDKIIFIPNGISPHKINVIGSKKERLQMTRLLIKGIKGLEVDDVEIQKEGVSYTIDTLHILQKKYRDMRLVVSCEAFKGMSKWKGYKEILKIAPPLVGCRCRTICNDKFVFIRCMDISSTLIRERIKKDLYVEHLLGAKVLDFIHQNNLY